MYVNAIPASERVCVCLSVRSQFQASSPQKLLGKSKLVFVWSLHKLEERNLFAASGQHDQDRRDTHIC